MRWWSEVRTRVRALFGRRRMERDLDEELSFHLEKETEKNLARGMSPERARREAYRRFGGVERHREGTREAWGVRWLEDGLQDLRLGVRRMVRSPLFSGTAVLTLALGVGGTVALFSVVQGLLLRPLPYEDDERLVVFWSDWDWRGVEFDLVREVAAAYEDIAAYSLSAVTLREGDRPAAPLIASVTSAELFDVLGARPLLGRTFRTGEDRPGAEPVVVLSHALWQQELGGDPDVVGRRVILDGASVTAIGVMPPDFYFPVPDVRAWMPLELDPDQGRYHTTGWLVLLGRVRVGTTDAQLQADLRSVAARLGERFTYPEAWDKTRDPHVRSLREYLTGDVRPVVLLLLGAVALLLLMATANLAALILARVSDCIGEMELRASLGAARGRLARQVLTETVLLGAVAGVLGGALAWLSFDRIVAGLPLRDGLASTLSLEWPVLGGGLATAVLVGALAGLFPLRALLFGRSRSLHAGARGASGAAGRRLGVQGGLVAAEVVVAVLLVSGATLFTRSVTRLYDLDVGVDPQGVGAIDLWVGADDVSGDDLEALLPTLVERVMAVPGVASAALVERLPLRDDGNQGPASVEDHPELEGTRRPNVYWRPVTPDYFGTMGIRLLEGRAFTAADGEETAPVGVVNEGFAREMWPGESALGKRVRHDGFGEQAWTTVVGVVADVPMSGVRASVPRVLYRPHTQRAFPWGGGTLVFRTTGDPTALVPAVREAVRLTDPRVAVARPTTMDEVVATSIGDVLRLRFFLGLLAALALVVGSVGVYGVVSYSVSRRTAEYGIRMALGAEPDRVVRGVLRAEMTPVAVGVSVGVGAALLASRAVAGLVWEVRPTDPVSLASGAAVLLVVATLAALLPALRASRVRPSQALRGE